jgi:hypothetical protein
VLSLSANQPAGAPRTRQHPDWHATLPDTRKPSTAHPNPIHCAHAAAASAAALLEEDSEDLGHRSQARRCRRADQDTGARSLVSVEDAGDVADAGVAQRRQRQTKAVPTEMSMACDDDAAPAPYCSSSASHIMLIGVLPKTYFCNKDNIKNNKE